jgi:ABC-2 type transport system permease protein
VVPHGFHGFKVDCCNTAASLLCALGKLLVSRGNLKSLRRPINRQIRQTNPRNAFPAIAQKFIDTGLCPAEYRILTLCLTSAQFMKRGGMDRKGLDLLRAEFLDLAGGLSQWRLWGSLAWYDIKSRYSRTWLGPLWTLANLIFFVLVIGLLYTELMHQEPIRFIAHLAVGWIVWTFVSNCILNGCNALVNGSRLIKEISLPLSVHLYRVVCRNFIILLYHSPVLLVILLLFPQDIISKIPILCVSLYLIVANVFWIAVLLSVICTRYQDVFEVMTNVIRVMFLLTPIIWTPNMISSRMLLLDLNPFYHMIEVFRGPLLGEWPRPISWWTLVAGLGFGWPLALYVLARFRDRIPFLV